jgi:hypothetical protein
MKNNDVIEETKKLILQEDLLLEMANIQKSDYNTPVGLWIDELGKNRQNQHGGSPRMKFVNNYNEDFRDLIDITISPNPKVVGKGTVNISNSDLKEIKQFISKNYEIFLKRWNNEISTRQMFKMLDDNN